MIALLLILFGSPAIWAFVRWQWASRPKAAPVAAFAFLTLVIGFRLEVGGDWDHYLLMLHRARIHSWSYAIGVSDPAYMLINLVAARLHLGLWFVNTVCAAIFSAGLVAFASRQPRPALALLIAAPVGILIVALGATRQASAVGLFMLAIALLGRGNRRSAVALLLVAPFFHWTAALLAPLAFPVVFRLRVATWVFPLFGLALGAFIFAVGPILYGQRATYFLPIAGGAMFRLVPTAAAVALLPWVLSRAELSDGDRLWLGYSAGLTATAATLLFWVPVAADRVNYYLIPLQMLVLVRVIDLLPGLPQRIAALLAVAASQIVLALGWLTFTNYLPCMLPYRSYLLEPQKLLPVPVPESPRRSGRCAAIFEVERLARFQTSPPPAPSGSPGSSER